MDQLFAAIFGSPGFMMETLTSWWLDQPYVPYRAGALGTHTSSGIRTLTVDVEFDGLNVVMIPSGTRGAAPTQYNDTKRKIRNFRIPFYPMDSTIRVSDIQNVRDLGSTNQLRAIESVIQKRMLGLTESHDSVAEFLKLGSLKGQIYDTDGTTVLYDLFSEFGIAQTVIDFHFEDTSAGVVMQNVTKVKRTIERALGNKVVPGFHCFCGDAWFDAFTHSPDVKEAYRLWRDTGGQFGAFLRNDNRKGFEFAGVTFENYYGLLPGPNGTTVNFMPPDEAHFFPVGVPGLFEEVFAPGDFMQAANTEGLPRYARIIADSRGQGIELLTESSPLSICKKPQVLIKGTTTGYPAGLPV